MSSIALPTGRLRPRHLLGIEGLSAEEITLLLDLSESYVEQNRARGAKSTLLRGRTIINLFFENSTRTRTSFELAGKRLGGDVVNMSAEVSSIKKGETLIDTAMTLNAMLPERAGRSGIRSSGAAASCWPQKVNCAVINAGDGTPRTSRPRRCSTRLTIRRRKKPHPGPDWWRSAATSCTAGWRARTSTC